MQDYRLSIFYLEFLFWILTYHRIVATLSLLYRYYFGRRSFELAQLVLIPFSRGRSTGYSNRLHDFFITLPRCYKDVYISRFSLHTARLWVSLLMECYSFIYDLNCCKRRINRHLLAVGSFWRDFLHALFFLCLFYL